MSKQGICKWIRWFDFTDLGCSQKKLIALRLGKGSRIDNEEINNMGKFK